MYVKIYPNESGYNYYYKECLIYQNSNKLKETDCEFAGFFFCLNDISLGFHYYCKILFDAELL